MHERKNFFVIYERERKCEAYEEKVIAIYDDRRKCRKNVSL